MPEQARPGDLDRLVLRPLREDDEAQALAADRELLAEDFPFLNTDADVPFGEVVAQLERERAGTALPAGVDQALVTCDEGNLASAATIERCGGVLEDVVAGPDGGADRRRYWVPVPPVT